MHINGRTIWILGIKRTGLYSWYNHKTLDHNGWNPRFQPSHGTNQNGSGSSKINNTGMDYRIQIIRTHGDMDQTTPLYRFKKRNAFVSTLENELIHHEVDLCIHSLKDLPSTPIDGSNHVFHPFHICLIFWPHCFYPYLANVRSSPDCSVDVDKSHHRYHTLRCSWHYG